MEGAGIVEAVGEGVTRFRVGDPAASAGGALTAYADHNIVAADRAVKPPPELDLRDVAAVLLKGMTVQVLLERTYPVQPGQTILVHAAAGGVGQLMVQWAKALGVTV